MTFILVRKEGVERLCFDDGDREIWTDEFTDGVITQQLTDLGVTIYAATDTKTVGGVLANVHPLGMTGWVAQTVAVMFFPNGLQ